MPDRKESEKPLNLGVCVCGAYTCSLLVATQTLKQNMKEKEYI